MQNDVAQPLQQGFLFALGMGKVQGHLRLVVAVLRLGDIQPFERQQLVTWAQRRVTIELAELAVVLQGMGDTGLLTACWQAAGAGQQARMHILVGAKQRRQRDRNAAYAPRRRGFEPCDQVQSLQAELDRQHAASGQRKTASLQFRVDLNRSTGQQRLHRITQRYSLALRTEFAVKELGQ
ncbi:hypothetical protein D3C81_1031690 [compost metagenome]